MQMLVDIHVHLADSRFADSAAVIRSARTAGVGWLLGTAARFNDWDVLTALATRFPICECALGVHPWYADEWSSLSAERLKRRARLSRVVAIGEIGLDFGARGVNRDRQMICFKEQVMIARDAEKPVVLHVHKAWSAMRELLKNTGLPNAGGVWHGFISGPELAKEALDMGLYVSFGGGVTDERNRRCRYAASFVPEDRLLVESDGPYQPVHRIRTSSSESISKPEHVVDVYETLAALRGVSVPRLAEVVARNASQLFGGRGGCR